MIAGGATPEWLLQGQVGICPCGGIGTRRKGNVIEKTINGGSRLVRQVLFAEDVAATDGLLQRLDPRVKLVTLLGLLITTAFVHHVSVLIGLYAVTLAMATAAGLSLGLFVKRVWLFIPIFTGIVVIPAMFSFITPGEIVVPFGTWFGHPVGMTMQGLTSAALMVSRVAVSISLVVLLTLTTPWNRLLAALRSVGVPRLFVMVLAMAYRYILHLLDAVADLYVARKARMVRPDADVATSRRFVASSAGALFGRSHALSEEVHLAMVARGYTGEVHVLTQPRPATRDLWWTVLCVAVAVTALGVDHLL